MTAGIVKHNCMPQSSKLFPLVMFLVSSTWLFAQSNVDQDKLTELSTEINQIIKATKAVGVSVALIDNYEIAWAKGFGVIEQGSNDSKKNIGRKFWGF